MNDRPGGGGLAVGILCATRAAVFFCPTHRAQGKLGV